MGGNRTTSYLSESLRQVNYDKQSYGFEKSLVFYTPKNYVRTFGTKRIRHREAQY